MNQAEKDQWAFLVNVHDSIEEGMLSSLLADDGIPVLKKSRGSGAYMEIYMGISYTGIDLYVPEGKLSESREIIESVRIIDEVEDGREGEEEIPASKKTKTGKRLITFLYLLPLALGFVYILISYLIELIFK